MMAVDCSCETAVTAVLSDKRLVSGFVMCPFESSSTLLTPQRSCRSVRPAFVVVFVGLLGFGAAVETTPIIDQLVAVDHTHKK